jgi:hypothetical protein
VAVAKSPNHAAKIAAQTVTSLLRIFIASLGSLTSTKDLADGIAQATRVLGEEPDASVELPVIDCIERFTDAVG